MMSVIFFLKATISMCSFFSFLYGWVRVCGGKKIKKTRGMVKEWGE